MYQHKINFPGRHALWEYVQQLFSRLVTGIIYYLARTYISSTYGIYSTDRKRIISALPEGKSVTFLLAVVEYAQ